MNRQAPTGSSSKDAYETFNAKLLPIYFLSITTFLSVALLVAHQEQWFAPASFVRYVDHHQGSVATVIQVLSHLLGMVNVYSLCRIINLSARAHLTRNPVSLDVVKSIHALYNIRAHWSLPWLLFLPVLAFVLVTLAPAALWAGAIAPFVVQKTTTQAMYLPSCSNDSFLVNGSSTQLQTSLGTFNYFPQQPPMQGQLLNAATDASYRVGNTTKQAKLDKTGYSYLGRSYGAGAVVGLGDQDLGNVTSYSYIERGFYANTTCMYNPDANIYFQTPFNMPTDWDIEVFNVKGTLPNWNGHNGLDFAALGYRGQPIVVAPAQSGNDTYWVGFAVSVNDTTTQFTPLEKAQCQTIFTPRNFLVSVDVLNLTISVLPQDEIELGEWSQGYQSLFDSLWNSLYEIQAFVAGSISISAFGTTVMTNIANVQRNLNSTSAATNLTGIADCLSNFIDNLMVLDLSAQLLILNDTTPSPVSVQTTFPQIAFGTPFYIYAVFVINIFVLLVYAIEAARTLFWHRIPRFNILDSKHAIIGASAGGPAIATHVAARHAAHGSIWRASAEDRIAGLTRVRVDASALRVVLAPDADTDAYTDTYAGAASFSPGDAVALQPVAAAQSRPRVGRWRDEDEDDNDARTLLGAAKGMGLGFAGAAGAAVAGVRGSATSFVSSRTAGSSSTAYEPLSAEEVWMGPLRR